MECSPGTEGAAHTLVGLQSSFGNGNEHTPCLAREWTHSHYEAAVGAGCLVNGAENTLEVCCLPTVHKEKGTSL